MKLPCRHIAGVIFLSLALVALTACGGASSPAPPPPPPPPTQTYSIGGTLSGLDPGQSLLLQDNGVDSLRVSNNGPFTFAAKVASGGAYAVAVMEWPGFTTCTVTGGAGVATASVTSVAVACISSPTFSIGGSVSGVVGQGLTLALREPCPYCSRHQRYSTVDRVVATGNGTFAFQSRVHAGQYSVVVDAQPGAPVQRCVVVNPGLVLTTVNVTDVAVACAEFSYVTDAGDNTLSAFSIDASTGALARVGSPVAAGLSPNAIAGTSNKKYLYTANGGSNDVSAWVVDASNGALTTVSGSPFAAGTNPKAVSAYTSGFSVTRGDRNVFLSYLYVANASSDNLSAYQIDQTTGALSPLSPATYATGTHPSAMAIDPTGPYLYTANAGGSNDISAFEIDGITGALSSIPGSPYLSGSKVSSLAFGAGGTFLFAADASGGTAAIFGFRVGLFGSSSGGKLTNLPGFPFPLTSCSYIVTDQTGAFLYATAGTNLLGYSIDAQSGALSPLADFPIAIGANATSLSVDPTNQFLYVALGGAGTATSFRRDSATGALSPISGSPFAVGHSADFIATF